MHYLLLRIHFCARTAHCLLFFSILFFSFLNGSSQDFSNKGKDFWISYGYHVRMVNSGAGEQMQLYITSDVNTNGNVEIASVGFSQSFSVTANRITTINIPRSAALTGQGLFDHGIHVTADKPVVVYSFIYVNAISGATVCLPTNTLGREYFSVNYTQVSNENNSNSFFNVIAADTGITTVEIIPSQDTKAGQSGGVPFTVTLTQGQVYQVLGKLNAGNAPFTGVDLTGSKIRSVNTGSGCKRLAVFCGSGKMSIGCPNAGSSDNLYQQMYPTATWGKKYIIVPGLVNTNNLFRIVKSDPSANITLNGITIAAGSFINNFYYEFESSQASVIASDKPILVAQYFTTQGCSGNGSPGDPEMVYLNPAEQTISDVTLNSMQPPTGTNITNHYLNVVIKNDAAAINSFKIDGISYSSFTPVPADNNYAYAKITTTAGNHHISSDTGFNIIAYGFGNAESYGYSGGTNLRDLYQFISIKNEYASVDFPASCKGSPFFFNMTFPYQPTQMNWVFNGLLNDTTILSPVYDSTWVVNGKQLYRYSLQDAYTINMPGAYPIKVVALNTMVDGCNSVQEIDYELQIFERPVADFSFTNSECITDTVFFTDKTSKTNGRSVIKYVWDFGDGNISFLKNAKNKYAVEGVYSASHSVISDIGCLSDTVKQVVTITPLPVAKFGWSSPACTGRSVAFSDSSTIATGYTIKKWKWDFGDGNILEKINGDDVNHTYNDAGVYDISLQVESANGCLSTVFTRSLNITPVPEAGFILPGVCLNDPFAKFTDTSKIADGTESQFKYQWDFGDANAVGANPNISVDKDALHRYSSVGVYDVSLLVTSNAGCKDSLTQSFTVNGAVPVADFVIQNENTLCSNTPVRVKDASSVDFGNIIKVEVYWDFAIDPTNKTVDDDPQVGKVYDHLYPDLSSQATKTYTIQYVTYSGISCVNTAIKTVTVNASPSVNFSPLPNVCEELPAFTLTNANDNTGLAGNGVYAGAGITADEIFNPALAMAGRHVLRYTFTAANGCSDYKEETIIVDPTPNADAGPDLFVLEGGKVTLMGSSRGNDLHYSWTPSTSLSNNLIATPDAFPVEDLVYRLTVTSVDGCSASDETFVKLLKAPVIPNVFTPNGDGKNDTWIITYLESYPGNTVDIYNRYGQIVFHSTGYNKAWDGTFNGKNIPSGTYYYIINPKNGRRQMTGFVDIIR
jgi:FOG: PKD repeat